MKGAGRRRRRRGGNLGHCLRIGIGCHPLLGQPRLFLLGIVGIAISVSLSQLPPWSLLPRPSLLGQPPVERHGRFVIELPDERQPLQHQRPPAPLLGQRLAPRCCGGCRDLLGRCSHVGGTGTGRSSSCRRSRWPDANPDGGEGGGGAAGGMRMRARGRCRCRRGCRRCADGNNLLDRLDPVGQEQPQMARRISWVPPPVRPPTSYWAVPPPPPPVFAEALPAAHSSPSSRRRLWTMVASSRCAKASRRADWARYCSVRDGRRGAMMMRRQENCRCSLPAGEEHRRLRLVFRHRTPEEHRP